MCNTGDVQDHLKTQLHLFHEISACGKQILNQLADGDGGSAPPIDAVLGLIEARNAAFVRLQQSPLPHGHTVKDLLEDPTAEVQTLAAQVLSQAEQILEQNRLLQERLSTLRTSVAQELQSITQSLQLSTTYHPRLTPTGGAYLDKRR